MIHTTGHKESFLRIHIESINPSSLDWVNSMPHLPFWVGFFDIEKLNIPIT
jgi:hypothetical protein